MHLHKLLNDVQILGLQEQLKYHVHGAWEYTDNLQAQLFTDPYWFGVFAHFAHDIKHTVNDHNHK